MVVVRGAVRAVLAVLYSTVLLLVGREQTSWVRGGQGRLAEGLKLEH